MSELANMQEIQILYHALYMLAPMWIPEKPSTLLPICGFWGLGRTPPLQARWLINGVDSHHGNFT